MDILGEFQRHGLGRIPAKDEDDNAFLLQDRVPMATQRTFRYWRTGRTLDQGDFPHCVGYAWRHYLESAPIMVRPTVGIGAIELYREAQRRDEWEGENYPGTSVRGGAKAAQAAGHISTYAWSFTVEPVRVFILEFGPVVFGTNWYRNMFRPDPKTGFVKPGGILDGGHAFLCIGYSQAKGAFRFLNSWGSDWGQGGRFWMQGEDVERLIREDGEACSAVEVKITR